MKVLIYILLLFSPGLNGQSVLLQSEVNSLLKGTNTRKLNLYGYFDGRYEVQLYLIHNDSDWAGICYYPSSKTKIYLEGGLVKNQLILNESDTENDNIGMWKIDINNSNHAAKWMNASGKVSFELTLKPFAGKNISNNQSTTATYAGNIINSEFNIIIYNISRYTKKASVINLDNATYLTNTLKCKNTNCTDFDLIITGDKKIKRLECHLSGKGTLEIDIYNQFITKFTTKLKKINTIKNGEISFINKKYCYYISFPNFKNKSISLRKKMTQFYKVIEEEMKNKASEDFDMQNRMQLSANAWFDIDFISNKIVSGTLISQKSYDSNIESKPLLVSTKNGMSIDIKKQFKSDFNYSFYVNQFLKDEINAMYKNKTLSKWYHLKSTDFKNVTLNKVGIVYSTDFNSIIGTRKIILPYKDIKDKLNRKSIIKKVML